MADGSWNYIPVQEGFSQGCPMLPVFAALVLGELLQEVDTHFRLKAASRLSKGAPMDDHLGGVPIILAYVDDVNYLLPHEDVEEFCEMIARLGAKLGAKLNTKKTCILTSTPMEQMSQGSSLSPAELAENLWGLLCKEPLRPILLN